MAELLTVMALRYAILVSVGLHLDGNMTEASQFEV
jgi:hypothetical protein